MRLLCILICGLFLSNSGIASWGDVDPQTRSNVLSSVIPLGDDRGFGENPLEEVFAPTEEDLVGLILKDNCEDSSVLSKSNSSKSWADVVSNVSNSTELPTAANFSKLPILRLTALQHDLRQFDKPARLYFESQGTCFTLCDNDGGATMLTIYALCMSDVRRGLLVSHERKKGRLWNKIKRLAVANFGLMTPLLRHSINRFCTANENDSKFDISSLKELDGICHPKQDLTYAQLFDGLGGWLRKNYAHFPSYIIEATSIETQHGGRFKTDKQHGICPVDKTLGFLCKAEKFETKLAANSGICEFECRDIRAVLAAYDALRHQDQGILNQGWRIHEKKEVRRLDNGAIEIVTVLYKVPIAQINQQSPAGKKKSDKSKNNGPRKFKNTQKNK